MFRTLVVRVSARQPVGQNFRLFLPVLPRGKDPDLVLSVRQYSQRNVLATLESRRMLQVFQGRIKADKVNNQPKGILP